MNQFDAHISTYIQDNKEAALGKIGYLKLLSYSGSDAVQAEFTSDKKIETTPELISYIAEKTAKNKKLIASDLDSHFSQVKEFLNIGKSYEIPQIGFIKSTKSGAFEFLPFSELNKPVKTALQSVKKEKQKSGTSFIQVITFLIVLAILLGLGWQAYQFFSKPKASSVLNVTAKNFDTASNTNVTDTITKHDTASVAAAPVIIDSTVLLKVKYIFETTASGLRAHTRTDQLKGLGSNAGFDSFVSNKTIFYNLYIIKPTKITDTLKVRDSLSKFLLRDIKVVVEH